jgi:hypothetical protein
MGSRATTSSSRVRLGPVLLAAAVVGGSALLGVAERSAAGHDPSTPRGDEAAPAAGLERLRHGIVSVRVSGQEWNWKTPWAKQAPWTRVVSGVVVAGRRILSADTAFGNHLLVEVQKPGRDSWQPARVVLVEPEGPLALLTVDDAGFWAGLEPLPLADPAPRGGDVTIHRWQEPGLLDRFPGTIRQVRTHAHGLSRSHLLTLEIGASTEGLGSSEVVVQGDHVVGLLTGRAGDAWVALASPVLSRFADDAAGRGWAGFPRAGIAWQELGNPALRAALGLRPDEGGVRLVRVLPHGSAASVLRLGDVLLEVGGVPLDPTGRYEDPVYGRMHAGLLFTERRPGDRVTLKVLRESRRLDLSLTLRSIPAGADKVPPYVYGRGPDYLVVGGLVFQQLTVPYLGTWGDWQRRAPPRLLIAYDREAAAPTPERPRIVLLTSVLPDAANLGYEGLHDLIVERVNGRTIGRMADLRAAFAEPGGGFDVVELLPGQGRERVVLDAAEAAAAGPRLRAAYGIGRLDSEGPPGP